MKKFMTAVLLLCLCSVQSFAMTPDEFNFCNDIIEEYRPVWYHPLLITSHEKATGNMAVKIGQVFGYWAVSTDCERIGSALLKECQEWQEHVSRKGLFGIRILTTPNMFAREDREVICKIAWKFADAFDTGNFTDFSTLSKYFRK